MGVVKFLLTDRRVPDKILQDNKDRTAEIHGIPGLNAIMNFRANNCGNKSVIFLETALEPAGEFIFTFFLFGWGDVIRGYLRPKKALGDRRIGARRGIFSKIPEIGNMIGGNIPGAEELSGRKVTNGVKSLWIVDGVIQFGLFNWMLLDITVTFFVTWFWGIASAAFEEDCALPWLLLESIGSAVLAISGWQGLIIPNVPEQSGDFSWNVGAAQNNTNDFQYILAITMLNTGSSAQLQFARVAYSDGVDTIVTGEASGPVVPQFGSGQLIVRGFCPKGFQIVPEIKVSQGAGQVTEAIVYLQG